MDQAQRYTRIIRILRDDEITAERLSEQLGVSIRTIYRDIAALRRQGVPVVGEPGVGYHLGDGALVDGLQLSTAEVEALMLATRKALAVADPHTARTLCDLQRKVDAAMPAALRNAMYARDALAEAG